MKARCSDGSCGNAKAEPYCGRMCWTCWLRINRPERYEATKAARAQAAASQGQITAAAPRWRWGDSVANALSLVGVTKARVSRVTGKPCKCQRRQDAMNRLGDRVRRFLSFGK